jgi:PAS domain-containing protein
MKSLVEEVLTLMRAPFTDEGGASLQHIQGIGMIFTILLLALVGFGVFLFLLWRRQGVLKNHARSCRIAQAVHPQGWVRWREGNQTPTFNPNFSKTLNLSRHVESFQDFLACVEQEDRCAFQNLLQDARDFPLKSWTRLLTKEGYRFFEVSCTRYQKTSGTFFCLHLQDQDQIKRHLDALEAKTQHCQSQSKLMIQALENLPLPLWVFHQETGKISYCNQAYADTLEVPKQQILEESMHLGNQSGSMDFWEERASLRYLNIRGQRRCYEFKKVSLGPENGSLAFAFDRSAEDSLERKLKRHLSLYREVLETLSAGVTVYGPDQRLRFFNHAYARMFGMDESWLSSEPSIGEVLDDLNRRRLLVEYSDYPAFKRREMNVVSGLLSPMQELSYLPDGRTIRKITAPHPSGGIFYIFEDVTNALELERRCNTQIEVQKYTLDNLYEGIAVFGSDARLRFTNPSFRKLWSWTPDGDADRRHMRELIEHVKPFLPDTGNWQAHKEKLIERVSDRIPKKRRIRRLDGVVLDFAYVPLPDGAHLLSFVDVTASCRIEEMLKAD